MNTSSPDSICPVYAVKPLLDVLVTVTVLNEGNEADACNTVTVPPVTFTLPLNAIKSYEVPNVYASIPLVSP